MSESDHADLSRRLAMAIGYAPEDVREFDYRDPAVIWPIAERYNCFPMRSAWSGEWSASLYDDLSDLGKAVGTTAAEAVARAVIGARE